MSQKNLNGEREKARNNKIGQKWMKLSFTISSYHEILSKFVKFCKISLNTIKWVGL
jgi:hypothetical protein